MHLIRDIGWDCHASPHKNHSKDKEVPKQMQFGAYLPKHRVYEPAPFAQEFRDSAEQSASPGLRGFEVEVSDMYFIDWLWHSSRWGTKSVNDLVLRISDPLITGYIK